MTKGRPKYLIIGLLVAVFYWLFDSIIHHFVFREEGFEIIPSDFNELWMRSLVVTLLAGFGLYAEVSSREQKRLNDEKLLLHQNLDDALTALLGGYLSICYKCKKVCTNEEHRLEKVSWQGIDSYLSHLSRFRYGQGFCPECAEETK